MSDQEIAAKLKSLSGAVRGLDKQTEEVVGKLLISEQDENVDADQETFNKLYTMVGGALTFTVLGATTMVFKYFDVYHETVTQEWSNATPEDQQNHYSWYMSRMAIIGVLQMVLHKIRHILFDRFKRSIGKDVHRVTLRRVLQAPVNTFFDVTPLGKIVNIFMGNLRVFYGEVLDAPNGIFEMLSHVFVVLSVMFAIGNVCFLVPMLGLMLIVGRQISKPYTYADNQLHKVGGTIWSPIHSYFHEAMRGKSIIRAFQQEQAIMAKQNALLDKTTTHFIAHHSCWNWYQFRMQWLAKCIQVCAIVTCVMNKGVVSNITLVLLLNWSDMGWLQHFFGCYNHIQRMMVNVQRVFNLQAAPQENYSQPDDLQLEKSWPAQGNIAFKDVELRYRPNTEIVLRKLNFTTSPGEKIGIVGRTGAGKSTISMALTRIVELVGGKIEIDGVDISKVGIARLRNEITMIPQDPVMFAGTLRYNLDPFDESTDERMNDLIKKAGLEYLLEGVSKKELKEKEEKEAKEKARKALLGEEDDDAEDSSSGDEAEKKKKADEKKKEKDEADKKGKDEKDSKDDNDDKGDKKKEEEDGKGLKFKV